MRLAWLAKIPRVNTPKSSNSYVCGVHFPGGQPLDDEEPPSRFLGKPVAVKRKSRVATGLLERSRAVEGLAATNTSVQAVAEPSKLLTKDDQSLVPVVEHDYGDVPVLLDNRAKLLEAELAKMQGRLDQANYHLERTKIALQKSQLHYTNLQADTKLMLF